MSNNLLWAFDFETAYCKNKDKSMVTMITFGNNYDQNVVCIDEYDGYDVVGMMFNKIVNHLKLTKRKSKNVVMYAHNASKFDNKYIREWLINNNFKQVSRPKKDENTKNQTNLFVEKMQEKTFTMLASDAVGILNIIFKYQGYVFYIKDFYRFIPTPLNKLGKLLGLEKIEGVENYYMVSVKDLAREDYLKYKEYAIRDTEILIRALNSFNTLLNLNSTNTFTIASTTFKSFLKHQEAGTRISTIESYKDKYNKAKRPLNELIDKKHYKGGFTYLNDKYRGELLDNVYYYDINSSYPAVMLDPVATIRVTKEVYDKLPEEFRAVVYKICILKADLLPNKIPFLRLFKSILRAENYENDIIYYKESFVKQIPLKGLIYYIWGEEWEYIKKSYDLEYEIVQTFYYQKEYYSKNYIEHLSKEKINSTIAMNQAKENNDLEEYYKQEAIRTTSKLKQNSKYGYLAKRDLFYNHLLLKEKYDVGEIIENDMDVFYIKSVKDMKINDHYIYVVANLNDIIKNDSNKLVSNHIFSGYITAKARIALYKQIEYVGYDNFIYCDTDSIFTKIPLNPEDIHPEEYGKWKLEGIFYFKALGPKVYLKSEDPVYPLRKGKPTIRGISRAVEGLTKMNVDIENFKWRDFKPNLLFKVTQFKDGLDGTVIVEENIKSPYRYAKIRG